MRHLKLPSGNQIPVLGLGTWRMGEHQNNFRQEANVIRAAIDMGIKLIDTAEMYGEGGAETVIGEAIRGRRDNLFLVSKFYPSNACHDDVILACERSLRRMNCDTIDLYLYHWPGSVPLAETFAALHELQDSNKIRDFGVSNFDLDDLVDIPEADQARLGCNQIFYISGTSRGGMGCLRLVSAKGCATHGLLTARSGQFAFAIPGINQGRRQA